jgi:diguanylate cyclase (GGDEF)-like protein
MLLITSPWTRAFFYIDRGRVMEGQLYGLQIPLLLTAQLTVLASAFALLRYAESANNRHKAVLAAVYPAFSLGMKWLAEVTGYTYLPMVAVIMTIGALHIYLWDLSQLVAVDPLTHINNRNRLYNYIETKREQKNCRLYLLMIDVNHFKSINDNYGHVEGDEALIRVSNALRHACRILAKSPFISRYGGDEFVIAAELAGDQELEELIANIHRNLNYFNEWAGVGYELTVSVGAVKVGSEPGDIRELIRMADRKLYEQKKRRKQGECDGRQNVHAENGIS